MKRVDAINQVQSQIPEENFLRSLRAVSAEIELSERGQHAFDVVCEIPLNHRLGRASQKVFWDAFRPWIVWAESKYNPRIGLFERFVFKLFWKALENFEHELGKKKIVRELYDQTLRDAAVSSDNDLSKYLHVWKKKLSSLILSFPKAWNVPGLSSEELIDELEVALIKAVRKPERFTTYERSGVEATYRLLASRKDYLRKKQKFFMVPNNGVVYAFAEDPITPEEALIAAQERHARPAAISKSKDSLSPTLRKWLSAIELEVDGWNSSKLNWARVASNMGKNRSSAVRARKSIMHAFERAGLEGEWD